MKRKTVCKEEMRRDLMRVYRQVTAEGTFREQYEAYKHVVEHEAPRFYVDARWALQRISPMIRGDFSVLEKSSAMVRQMYYDLFDVVVRLSQKEKFRHQKLFRIVCEAVKEPAPRFYISADRMRQIWVEEVQKRRSETKQKLQS